MTSITEQAETAHASTTAEPKATKGARVGARRAHNALKKGKAGKKATSAKKTPTARKGAKKAERARDGSKAAKILDLLKRSGGATMKELMKATGWQPHSVRGFLSGTLRKRMGIDVASAKSDDSERSYSIKG